MRDRILSHLLMEMAAARRGLHILVEPRQCESENHGCSSWPPCSMLLIAVCLSIICYPHPPDPIMERLPGKLPNDVWVEISLGTGEMALSHTCRHLWSLGMHKLHQKKIHLSYQCLPRWIEWCGNEVLPRRPPTIFTVILHYRLGESRSLSGHVPIIPGAVCRGLQLWSSVALLPPPHSAWG